jgi:hypothetical protein
MQFSLYTSGQGGSPIWSETQQVVISGGIFSTMLGKLTPITASTVSVNELWLGVKVGTDPEMTPRQRIGSTVYALVAEQLANPKNPTIILSHDGILKSDITCSTPKNQLVIWGAGFHPNEDVTISAVTPNGSSSAIFTATADSNGTFMKQGSSTSPAITCNVAGPLTVTAIGNQGSVSSRPVLIAATPTPGPTATPSPTPTPIATTPTPVPTTIINSQILTSTTTWTLSGSPYLVKGNIRVDKGVTLTIEPGVDIRFVTNAGLEILGTLRAIGTATQTISFMPSSISWRGIQFRDPSSDHINGAGNVIEWSLIDIGDNSVTEQGLPAITIQDSSPKISNNAISGTSNLVALVLLENGHPRISHNTFECEIMCLWVLRRSSNGLILEPPLIIEHNRIKPGGFLIAVDIVCANLENLTFNNNSVLGSNQSASGVTLHNCQNVIFTNNIITNWSHTDGGELIIDTPGLSQAGIPVKTQISRNHFEGNYVSLKLEGVSNFNNLVIDENNFINNTGFAVQLKDVAKTVVIPVSDSYWGTTDPTAISNMIFDNLDDFNLGTVNVINPVPQKIDISSE